MLKYEVDMEDKEMQQAECCVLEEFPPTLEPNEHIMRAATTQEHEVIDISSKRKEIMDVGSHAVAQQPCTDHEQNDPPIEPDQPPPDDKIVGERCRKLKIFLRFHQDPSMSSSKQRV